MMNIIKLDGLPLPPTPRRHPPHQTEGKSATTPTKSLGWQAAGHPTPGPTLVPRHVHGVHGQDHRARRVCLLPDT
jgi:hypothetical protein